MSSYQSNIAQGMNHDEARNMLVNAVASAKDQELNGLTDSRNQFIDQLNRTSNATSRDAFLNGFNTVVDQYHDELEQIKNQL